MSKLALLGPKGSECLVHLNEVMALVYQDRNGNGRKNTLGLSTVPGEKRLYVYTTRASQYNDVEVSLDMMPQEFISTYFPCHETDMDDKFVLLEGSWGPNFPSETVTIWLRARHIVSANWIHYSETFKRHEWDPSAGGFVKVPDFVNRPNTLRLCTRGPLYPMFRTTTHWDIPRDVLINQLFPPAK